MQHRMKNLSRVGAVALCLLAMAGASAHGSGTADRRDVLRGVDALFSAMATHDVAAARRLIVPGASFVVVKPDGSVAMEHDTDFLQALAGKKGVWRERIWQPRVMLDGDLAQVWAPYDFHLDGKLSHCGIDSFSLVRGTDGWRIAGISYSVRKQGCAASPLGRPAN
jgi:hypothetical protein